jgi:hypothetical protein
MGRTTHIVKSATRLLSAVLVSALLLDPTLATALQSREPSCSFSIQPTFSRQALIARLAGMVTFGKTANKSAHQPVHNAYKAFIGADVGGNLRRMSRMLRYLAKGRGGLFREDIHAWVTAHSSGNRYDAALIASVRKDAERLLRQAGLPHPRHHSVRIVLLDLPDNRHARAFIRYFVEPEDGVRAIHYELPMEGHIIAMRREDFTAQRLAHELGEVALMIADPLLHWTQAHNLVNAAGLGRGHIRLLHLPVITDENAIQAIIEDITKPLFARHVARVFRPYGVAVTPAFINDVAKSLKHFDTVIDEISDALEDITDQKLRDANPDGPELSIMDRAGHWIAQASLEERHLPSKEEVMRESVGPVLAHYGIGAKRLDVMIPQILDLSSQNKKIEACLLIAPGIPLNQLIDSLVSITPLGTSNARWLASKFARRLGWTDDQVAEALSSASIASSQYWIGADVGGEDSGPLTAFQQHLPSIALLLIPTLPLGGGLHAIPGLVAAALIARFFRTRPTPAQPPQNQRLLNSAA